MKPSFTITERNYVGAMSKLAQRGAFLLLALLALAGCKSDIRSGDYGPLSVGQPKLEALAALRASGISSISPVLYENQYIGNPTRAELTEVFSDDNGILVWISGYPQPLRIEFEENLVSKTWPETLPVPLGPDHMKVKEREVARLKQIIGLGMSRDTVFDVIANFETKFEIAVGNFVVGYQRFYVMTRDEIDANRSDYRILILANDGWEFSGLTEEVWYTPIVQPFYSRVTIYFRNDRIERIEHFHLPFEVP